MENNNLKKQKLYDYLILAAISLAFGFLSLLFFSSSLSPVYGGMQYGHNDLDANYFLYLGYGYANGLKPYVDLFDHKGMYIFWIEGLGALMGGRSGMYVIASIYMSVNFFCLVSSFKELGYQKLPSYFLGSVVSLILACFSAGGGHHSGELLNPYFCLLILFYLRGIKRSSNKDFYIGSFFAGLSAGLAFSSRPSEAVLPFAAVVFYFVYWLKKKKDITLLWNAILALGVFILPIGAAVIESLSRGFFEEMMHCMVSQNSKYLIDHFNTERLIDMLFTIAVVITVLVSLLIRRKKTDKDIFLFFIIMVSMIGLVQIIIARFINYWISMLPICLLALGNAYFPKTTGEKLNKFLASLSSASFAIVSVLFVLMSYVPESSFFIGEVEMRTSVKINKECEQNMDNFIESKDPNHEKEVFLLDANLGPLLYVKRLSSFKYTGYQSWWSKDDPEIKKSVLNYIKTEKPCWIITAYNDADKSDELYTYVFENYKTLGKDFYFTYFELK